MVSLCRGYRAVDGNGRVSIWFKERLFYFFELEGVCVEVGYGFGVLRGYFGEL